MLSCPKTVVTWPRSVPRYSSSLVHLQFFDSFGNLFSNHVVVNHYVTVKVNDVSISPVYSSTTRNFLYQVSNITSLASGNYINVSVDCIYAQESGNVFSASKSLVVDSELMFDKNRTVIESTMDVDTQKETFSVYLFDFNGSPILTNDYAVLVSHLVPQETEYSSYYAVNSGGCYAFTIEYTQMGNHTITIYVQDRFNNIDTLSEIIHYFDGGQPTSVFGHHLCRITQNTQLLSTIVFSDSSNPEI